MKLNNTIKKILLVKKSISSHLFAIFLKNLKPKTYKLQPSFKDLSPKTYHLKPSRGFTLVELLVTLSLFVTLTTIVLFSSSQFNGSILLTNLAYDVAITIRQAQSFGVNVREVSTDVFDKAYGVHFDTNKNTEFILFADTSPVLAGDNIYTEGSDSRVDTYTIKRGNKISGISCEGSLGYFTLDIIFIRPNPDAKIMCGPDKKNEAKIKISSADGSLRFVVVNSTGQISVER